MKNAIRVTAAIVNLLVLLSSPAWALITVTDYSWLQLPPGSVTVSVGSDVAGSGSANGSPADFRWAQYVWVPNTTLTANGTTSYWGIVTLDQPRNVQSVGVEAWSSTTETLKAYHIDGYKSGSWVNDIGLHDFGTFTANPYGLGYQNVAVTPDTYSAIRVRFEPSEYTRTGSYGGPGLKTVEPRGDGSFDVGDSVNWADKDQFGTTIVNNLFPASHSDTRLNVNWNSGLFGDSLNGNGTGASSGMVAGEYLQLDLKAVRTIDRVTVLGLQSYTPTTFTVEGSTDGSLFTALTPLSTAMYPSAGDPAANVYDFAPFDAQFIRITNANKPGDYWLITQVLAQGTLSIPEPGIVGLLALGGLMVWVRRQR